MDSSIERSYDQVAAEYTSRIAGELEHKPFDRSLLDRFVREAGPLGPICDLGCGPGHVGRYLYERGASVIGIDLSSGMVEEARRLNSSIRFLQGSMLNLPLDTGSLGGIVAFYSIIHLLPEDLPTAFAEMQRVLKAGGHLLVAFHLGDEVRHLDEWWDHPVSIDFVFYRMPVVLRALRSAGFALIEQHRRDPYPEVEHPSRRGYIWARKLEAE